jgi:hypothetical protein
MSPIDREALITRVMEAMYRQTETFHDTQVPLWKRQPEINVAWRGMARIAVDIVKEFYEQ